MLIHAIENCRIWRATADALHEYAGPQGAVLSYTVFVVAAVLGFPLNVQEWYREDVPGQRRKYLLKHQQHIFPRVSKYSEACSAALHWQQFRSQQWWVSIVASYPSLCEVSQ
jgi:hypothetical protein